MNNFNPNFTNQQTIQLFQQLNQSNQTKIPQKPQKKSAVAQKSPFNTKRQQK